MTLPPKYPLQSLMAIEAKHVAELNKILTMSVKRLEQDIKALGKTGANPLTIMQAKATKASLENFLAETFEGVEAVIGNGVKSAAMAASGVVSAYEAQLLGLVMSPEAVANLTRAEAQRAAWGIEAAMQRVQGNSYQPLASSVYKTQQLTLKWVDKRITQALASGWSRQRLAQELASMIDPSVKGGVSYAANRTARTEINNAFHASSVERYNNSPIVLGVDWNLSSSHPEGDICDTLADESPYAKNNVPQKPHPQCYCYITPSLPEPAKFLDNMFKGKYGDPKLVDAAETVVPKVAKAGSKAAKTAAQNAIHKAIKSDPAPSKKTLGNLIGVSDNVAENSILNPAAAQKLINNLDDAMKQYVAKSGQATQKYVLGVGDDDLDTVLAWIKKETYPNGVPNNAWVKNPTIVNAADKDYDELLDYMMSDMVDVLKTNGISPDKVLNAVKAMDEEEWMLFQKIINNAGDFKASQKFLHQAMDLDPDDNAFIGNLSQLAKGLEPKKIITPKSLVADWNLNYHTIDNLLDVQKMTPDQIEAQLLKFSADDLAEMNYMSVSEQAYYIKHGTTPTKDSFLKPTTPVDAPDYEKIADILENVSQQALMDSGIDPETLWYVLKSANGGKGYEAALKAYPDQGSAMGMINAFKGIKVADQFDSNDAYLAWKKKHGFMAADDVAPSPKLSYADLENDYGSPASVWEETGLSADDIKAALEYIDSGVNEALAEGLEEAFDEFDNFLLSSVVKEADIAVKKAGKSPIIDPPTIPKPVPPSPVPLPKPMADSYQDLGDIFPKAEWKPNLLAKTGASPTQIADYVNDMTPAEYDHFMSLKWPSQKKHFEKLAKNKTDNAAAYSADLKFAEQVAIDTSKIGEASTKDPAILAKYRGKNAPAKPIEPVPPKGADVKAEMDAWLKKAEAKYEEFAPGKKLNKSNNWSYFQNVIDKKDFQSAEYLFQNKYLDYKLTSEVDDIIKRATTPNATDAAAYKKSLEAYAKAKADFDKAMLDWRAANGITSQAKGVWDDVLVHDTNAAGVRWANDNLPVATGSGREAVKKYSGSSYTPWNDALRKNANGNTLPGGQWGEWTRKADQAMSPIPEDVIVRRGTSWEEFFAGGKRGTMPPPPPNELVGSVQTQHGYTSTSVGATSAFSPRPVALRIRVPQGHPATWVEPYSSHKGERELLISRSTNYYIHDVYKEGNIWYIDAEIIPIGEDPSVWTPVKSMVRAAAG